MRFLAVALTLAVLPIASPAMVANSTHHATAKPLRIVRARKPVAAKSRSASRATVTRNSSGTTHSVVHPLAQSAASPPSGLVFTWDSERQGDHPRNCIISDASSTIIMPWYSSPCDGAREQWAQGQVSALQTHYAASSTPVQVTSQGASPSTAVLNRSPGVTFLPKGTPIAVRTMSGHNSYAVLSGEKIRYEVVEDVIVNGSVIAKAGDTAYGKAQEAQRGECGFSLIICWTHATGASLRVSVDEVYNFCGDTIHVDYDRSEYRSGIWAGSGLFGNNSDVVIAKGQTYLAETDRPQRVCGERTTAQDPPPPKQALRTSDH
jgi:hypothetical protein